MPAPRLRTPRSTCLLALCPAVAEATPGRPESRGRRRPPGPYLSVRTPDWMVRRVSPFFVAHAAWTSVGVRLKVRAVEDVAPRSAPVYDPLAPVWRPPME